MVYKPYSVYLMNRQAGQPASATGTLKTGYGNGTPAICGVTNGVKPYCNRVRSISAGAFTCAGRVVASCIWKIKRPAKAEGAGGPFPARME